jgi:hypothetical protein
VSELIATEQCLQSAALELGESMKWVVGFVDGIDGEDAKYRSSETRRQGFEMGKRFRKRLELERRARDLWQPLRAKPCD